MCKAIAVERGCGERQAGAIYLEVGLGPGGKPIEHFLCDHPIVVDPEAMGLSSIGVKLIEEKRPDAPSVWHVFDIVGSRHYKNVADFVEEAARFGISRRVSKTLDFSKLTAESRLMLLHQKAWIEDWRKYWPRPKGGRGCPKHREEHAKSCMCAGLWWEDIDGGEPIGIGSIPRGNEFTRPVKRTMPSFEYEGFAAPDGKISRRLAIFGSFPLHRIVAVRDRAGNTHEEAAEKARASSLPVEFEDK